MSIDYWFVLLFSCWICLILIDVSYENLASSNTNKQKKHIIWFGILFITVMNMGVLESCIIFNRNQNHVFITETQLERFNFLRDYINAGKG